MNNDKSLKHERRLKIEDMLRNCDSDSSRISILIDKVIELEDCLLEYQDSHLALMSAYKKLSCAQVPF